MKKILSIALCAATASAFADPVVTELGEVGVTAITNSLTNVIVAVSYDDLAGGTGMVYSNLVKTTNLTADDRLIEFRENKYTGWVLRSNGSVKYWEAVTGVFKDGAGNDISLASQTADMVSGAVGTGIWLIRQNPTEDNKAVPFYIYGKPSTAKTITTTAGVWNLVGNPTQGDVTITKTIAPGANNDEILVPGKQGLVRYLYKTGANDGQGGWLRAKDAEDKWGPAPAIEAGTGFWIKTKEAITINWQPADN